MPEIDEEWIKKFNDSQWERLLEAAKPPELNRLDQLLDEILHSDFIREDSHSRDHCTYCGREYGNFWQFGHASKTVQENHRPNCIYRLAFEIREEQESNLEDDQCLR